MFTQLWHVHMEVYWAGYREGFTDHEVRGVRMMCNSCQMKSSVAAPIFGFQIGVLLHQLLQHWRCAKVRSPVACPLALLCTRWRLSNHISIAAADPLLSTPLAGLVGLRCPSE